MQRAEELHTDDAARGRCSTGIGIEKTACVVEARGDRLEMTEYEIADLTASVLSNFLTAFTVFLSVLSAYVISAFAAGDRLTRVQLVIVNLCFVASVGILGFLVVSLFRRFHALAQSISVERGTIAAIDFTWPLSLLLVVIVLGCFVFMWNVRDEAGK